MRYIITLLLFFFIYDIKAQSKNSEAALYNIGFGGVSGAIGALINKKEGEKTGKVLLKGLWQGALGGYVTFESKRILSLNLNNDDWKIYWASNILNSAGNSIKENASNNTDFWDQWNFHIGFNRLEFHTKNGFNVKYKLMPITAGYTIDAFFRYKFDLSNSLKYSHLIFQNNNMNPYYLGQASNSFIITNNEKISKHIYTYNQLVTHEIIHLYQRTDFLLLNSYYNNYMEKLYIGKPIACKYSKYIYTDFHLIINAVLYEYEFNNSEQYYDNFFESEAGYYSNTKY